MDRQPGAVPDHGEDGPRFLRRIASLPQGVGRRDQEIADAMERRMNGDLNG